MPFHARGVKWKFGFMRNRVSVTSLFLAVSMVLLLCIFSGCGHRSNLPPLVPVSGKVTLDGKPIDANLRMQIQFIPDSSAGTHGPTGGGGVAADGSYEIVTAGQTGAIVGTHTVRIIAKPSLPGLKRLENPKTSDLKVEVLADQKDPIDLELVSAPAVP